MAAVMAVGTDAVLSHGTAASAWDLCPRTGGAIHLTLPRYTGRSARSGLRIHRSITLRPTDISAVRGIPVTSPARTVVDLASSLRGRPLEQVLDRAERHRLVDFSDLRNARSRSLKAVLSHYTGDTVTRSELEEAFLRLCDDHDIQRPAVNTHVEGEEVDFVWPGAGLIVEVDGYAYHRSPSAFETDRERDVVLALAGWQVMRFTWMQVTGRAAWVARAISECLASSRSTVTKRRQARG